MQVNCHSIKLHKHMFLAGTRTYNFIRIIINVSVIEKAIEHCVRWVVPVDVVSWTPSWHSVQTYTSKP